MTLPGVSRAGFGGYRISERNPEHLAALELALEMGCNLFDTAPNYGDGESERLIGKTLAKSRRSRIFVISKVGYVSNVDADFFRSHDGQGALKSTKQIDARSFHCLHPRFIEFKVHSSLRNLRLDHLDAVLLHNPEYQLGSEFDHVLAEAFATLDRLVTTGLIRTYGVSSNRLPFQTAVTLDRLLDSAVRIGSNSGFGIIQFPFNIAEWDATTPQGDQPSLLAIARARGITTVANRPLNAQTEQGAIRLFTCGEERVDGSAILADFTLSLGAALAEKGIEGDIHDLPAVAKFRNVMQTTVDPSELARLFDLTFGPILEAVSSPRELIAQMRRTSEKIQLYARQRMARSAHAFAQQPQIAARTLGVRGETLQVIACQTLLDAGVDHVLIGMRRPEYVAQFNHLF